MPRVGQVIAPVRDGAARLVAGREQADREQDELEIRQLRLEHGQLYDALLAVMRRLRQVPSVGPPTPRRERGGDPDALLEIALSWLGGVVTDDDIGSGNGLRPPRSDLDDEIPF